MSNFWVSFAVSEAVGIAQAAIQASGISDTLKTALESFIAAGQTVVSAIHAKK